MSDTIKSIVRFVNVAAGAQATLPHGLSVANRGGGVIPDELKIGNGDFSLVSADATDIVVQNNAAAVASCDVLCEWWHTYERAFGAQNTTALTPRPFVAGSGGAGAGGAGAIAFIYQPGGVQAGNVFNDWDDVVAAMALVEGPKLLEFRDNIVSPCPIPAGGPYDMEEVRWWAYREFAADGQKVLIDVIEGVTFNKLRQISGELEIDVRATATVPDTTLADNDVIEISGGAQVEREVPGAVPLWSGANLVATDTCTVLLGTPGGTGGVLLGPGPLIDFPVVGTTLRINGQVNSQCEADTVAVAAGATLFLFTNATTFIFNTNQPSMLGTLIDFPLTNLRMLVDQAPTTGNQNLTRNEIGRFDTTAALRVANLPTAASMGRGQFVGAINETGGNNVNVTATGGDTVNGGATNAVTPGTAALYVSDGVSAWFRMT